MRGFGPGRFSTNVTGGRCEACQGRGTELVEMHFLSDVEIPCEQCGANLTFAIGQQRLKCPYCGHEKELALPDDALRIFERRFP